jgi:hypothetical protein
MKIAEIANIFISKDEEIDKSTRYQKWQHYCL